jgi:hypothetical protein
MWQQLFRSLAWDGLLPVFVLLVNLVPRFLFAQVNPVLVMVTAFVVPLFAALARASMAYDQLKSICGGTPGVLRQIGVAIAIVLLLGFEAAVGAMTWANNVAAGEWLAAGGLYAAYLLVISLSLLPPRWRIAEGSAATTGF